MGSPLSYTTTFYSSAYVTEKSKSPLYKKKHLKNLSVLRERLCSSKQMESRVVYDCCNLALLELCQEYKQADSPSTKSPDSNEVLRF